MNLLTLKHDDAKENAMSKKPEDVAKQLWDYYEEYVAYNNSTPADNHKYFHFTQDLASRYQFLSNSPLLRGKQADDEVIVAYAAIKLAKVRKIDRWIFDNKLTVGQINYCTFLVKALGVSDEYLDELHMKRERLALEKERVKAMKDKDSAPVSHTVTVGFE